MSEEYLGLMNTIFIGEIASVQEYGAFVKIPGNAKQGLIHRSQISSTIVDDVSEVLQTGEKVFCKVVSVKDGKIGLSMKYVNQGTGKDLDPNGVQSQKDEQQRRVFVPNSRKKIELDAVLNTTCSKCGTRGHMSRDCFKSPDGKTYDLLPEDDVEEESLPSDEKNKSHTSEKKTKKKKKEKKKKHKKRKKQKSSHDNSDSEESSHSSTEGKRRKKRHSTSTSSDAPTNKKKKHH